MAQWIPQSRTSPPSCDNDHSLSSDSACKLPGMGGEIVLMVVVAFACAVIGFGALHLASKLPTPRLGAKVAVSPGLTALSPAADLYCSDLGFRPRASFCAWVICARVIFLSNSALAAAAPSKPCAADRLNHMWAWT
jgi:hypothetical protein